MHEKLSLLYQYVLFSTCSFRTLRDARKALVTFVSSYLSAFYRKQVLQHLPLPLRGCFSPFEVNLESETYVHQRTGIRGSEHGAVILPRGTAVVECHTCVHADHVVLEEGVLIAQARVACQAGDMVLPGGGGVVFGLDLREQGRRLKAEAVGKVPSDAAKQRPSAKYHPMPA